MADFAHHYPQAPSLPSIELGLTRFLPDDLGSTLHSRLNTQELFGDDPTNASIWEMVADHALSEEARGIGQPEELRDVPTAELAAFAGLVRRTEQSGRYALTTDHASNGERWYDILYGLHSPAGNDAIAAAIDFVRRGRWDVETDHALDIATGTGKTAYAISRFVYHTIGLDRDGALLAAAHADVAAVDFVRGNVDALPFPDNSMNVITSDGIKFSLPKETTIAMYREIARVLRPGGTYIDTEQAEPDGIVVRVGGLLTHADYHPEYLKSFVTWKALLQDMIVDSISGVFVAGEQLQQWGPEWDQLMQELGLYEEWVPVGQSGTNCYSHARILHKL